ncbi:hypothetical protein BGZ65_004531, partial [Modicella reniformis]
MEPEARVCLIINRFSRNLIVMYASSACEKVLRMDPDQLTGQPILLYIRADDLASFVEQVDVIKRTTVISQMRFWFQSPNWPREIPCEAILIGSADGVLAVVRRCKPFFRKRRIVGREQFEASDWGSSASSSWTRSNGSSLSTTFSPRTYGGYESKSPSPSWNISRATLNQIRILELDDNEKTRPLTNNSESDPKLDDVAAAAGVPTFKEIITQDFEEHVSDDEDGDDIGFDSMVIKARFLWISPTVYDVLGYEPEELFGEPGYNIVFPGEIPEIRTFHKENLINDLVASQIVLRYKGKDGRPVHCLVVISLCYDFIVNCATSLDPDAGAYVMLRAHSHAMTRMVGSKNE